MKKQLAVLLALCMIGLTACSFTNESEQEDSSYIEEISSVEEPSSLEEESSEEESSEEEPLPSSSVGEKLPNPSGGQKPVVKPTPPPAVSKPADPPVESSQSSEEQSSSSVPEPEIPNVGGKYFREDIENQIIDLLNAERESLGLGTLEYNHNLHMASRIRSKELCQSDFFEHLRPDGREWYTVLSEDVPTSFYSAGENLAMVETVGANGKFRDITAQYWFDIWKNSPTHYENMIKEEYDSVGMGVYYKKVGDEFAFYATTLFGKMKED